MAVLELRAVNLQDGSFIPQQGLGGSFHQAGLARAGRTQEKQIREWSARGRESGAKNLVDPCQLAHSAILAYHLAAKALFETLHLGTSPIGIQYQSHVAAFPLP